MVLVELRPDHSLLLLRLFCDYSAIGTAEPDTGSDSKYCQPSVCIQHSSSAWIKRGMNMDRSGVSTLFFLACQLAEPTEQP